jgi:2-phosphosulfolactate phosphatase
VLRCSGKRGRSPYSRNKNLSATTQTDVILTPAEIALLPARDLSRSTCVVFDVLRATSTFLTALAHGASRIYPVGSVEEALELHQRLPQALLGGERGGVRLPGFDLGNSPREYTVESVGGRDIISTTTNGPVALRACAHAAAVFAGALLNADALAAHLRAVQPAPERLLLVCAGTGADFAWEDAIGAGSLLTRLGNAWDGGDAAQLVRNAYAHARTDLAGALGGSVNGQRLQEIGLGGDVAYCASEGSLATVALLRNGALSVV